MNDASEKELRRQRSILRCLGTGVIALSLWSVIKTVLITFLLPSKEMQEGLAGGGILGFILSLIFVFLFLLALVSVRLWLGLSARAEGMGKPKGRAYMIVAFLFLGYQTVLLLGAIALMAWGDVAEQSFLELTATYIVEITSVVIMGELAFTARKVKKLTGSVRKAE